MKKILVLKGGNSPEREISLISGSEVAKALLLLNYNVSEIDPADYPRFSDLLMAIEAENPYMVFNGLHGGCGENGDLQAALQLAGIPFTGSLSKGSTLAMDKYIAKLIVSQEGVPVPKHILMRGNLLEDYNDPEDYKAFTETLGLPIIVKPNDAGSSVGISMVEDLSALKTAVDKAFKYCSSVLLEEYIPGRELTVSILNGKALPVVEIKPRAGWYDYTNKYTKGKTEYLAPAPIDEAIAHLAQLYAVRAFNALSCSVYGRVDFRLDNDKLYFLEVNTLPGMTALSLTPMAAKAAGIAFSDLLVTIIENSVARHVEVS
ncbi:MAG: D-alanine--D-alanine ligase [Candidatus Cloacimonetes bacterium]|jgi:D-alanine-D-alanine ligase|nr:D-alanine--D-alanine ligase [Candidatus Cloacimonadota bacterium]MDD2507014.1 D-alanine--D-alanine ligase [Candidatus Cloacimonadota bacterium]MDD4147849.1 D-alanine--D-alanine ligase [Candidatus Cloacimonadota bacterium]MDD4560516.1 D-alanine--D-alanine ligase [Candidatus Cloacimonadota bacterium]